MADLSVCMIARDEEDCIGQAIESVRDVASEIIVVDTGSCDRTREIALGLGAKVIKRRWTGDFSVARNAALEYANCGWVLVIDADERLRPESRSHVRRALHSDAEGCLVKIVNFVGDGGEKEISAAVRVFRNRPYYRFTGLIHEQIGPAIQQAAPDSVMATEITLDHFGYMDSFVERKAKKTRNLDMAREAVAQDPEDAFARFNLGVELFRLGRLEEAESEFERSGRYLVGTPAWGSKLFKTWATTRLRLGNPEKALTVAEAGLILYPGFTDLYHAAGLAHLELERYEQAESLLIYCIKRGNAPVPPFAAADMGIGTYKSRFALGRVHLCNGRYQEAAREFRIAFEANDRWSSALTLMGAALRAAGEEDSFIGYLKGLNRGSMFLAEIACAAWMFDRVTPLLEGVGPSFKSRYIRALALMGTGRYDEAEPLFQALAETGPMSRESRAALLFCRVCLGTGSLEDAAGWPEADRRLLTQHSYTKDILTLERSARERPFRKRVKTELKHLRKEARRGGYRDV